MGTYEEHTLQSLCQSLSAIGGLPVPVAALAMPRPVRPCFPDPELRNPNRLDLISFHFARTRAYARLRGRWLFEPMRRWRRRSGPDGGEGISGTLSRRSATPNVYGSARGAP